MLTDKATLLAVAQAITVDVASAQYLDLSSSHDVGAGEPLHPFLRVAEAFDALTTLDVSLQYTNTRTAGVPDFGTPLTMWTKSIALASLTLNAAIPLPDVPAGFAAEALRFYFDVVGSGPSVGKVTAGFAADKPANAGVTY